MLQITITSPIQKIFWFDTPKSRNGWFIEHAVCPCCGNPEAEIQSFRITHHRFGKRLVCDACGYGEMKP